MANSPEEIQKSKKTYLLVFGALLVCTVVNHEKKAVYWIFGAGIVIAICLFGLTGFADLVPIFDPHFFGK